MLLASGRPITSHPLLTEGTSLGRHASHRNWRENRCRWRFLSLLLLFHSFVFFFSLAIWRFFSSPVDLLSETVYVWVGPVDAGRRCPVYLLLSSGYKTARSLCHGGSRRRWKTITVASPANRKVKKHDACL
ncbi:hypothetical protein YC2023_045804 [Brassica napus]